MNDLSRSPTFQIFPPAFYTCVAPHESVLQTVILIGLGVLAGITVVWALERCRISPPCFLAECCKRQLNQGSFVLLYFRLFTFSDLYWVCLSVFSCTVLFVVSVNWLAVKTASEMTYIVSSGALNSTPTNQIRTCTSSDTFPRHLKTDYCQQTCQST